MSYESRNVNEGDKKKWKNTRRCCIAYQCFKQKKTVKMIIGVSNRFQIECIITHQTPPHIQYMRYFVVLCLSYYFIFFRMLYINIEDISSQFQFFSFDSYLFLTQCLYPPKYTYNLR